MNSFDDRRRDFEGRYANDADARFRIEARRDKIVGAWAAGKLGKSGPDADAYAKEVVRADLEEAGDDDVFRKLRADLPGTIDDQEIRKEMAKALDAAMAHDAGKSAS